MAEAAVRGTVLVGVLLAAGIWLRPPIEPVASRIVRLEGGAEAGWYEADDLGEAALDAGVEVPLLAGVRDGDVVRIIDGVAVPSQEHAPIDSMALGRRLGINRASATELEALPGIGPALAARIVEGRPYRTVDDLDRVKGIGPKKVAALRPLVEP